MLHMSMEASESACRICNAGATLKESLDYRTCENEAALGMLRLDEQQALTLIACAEALDGYLRPFHLNIQI